MVEGSSCYIYCARHSTVHNWTIWITPKKLFFLHSKNFNQKRNRNWTSTRRERERDKKVTSGMKVAISDKSCISRKTQNPADGTKKTGFKNTIQQNTIRIWILQLCNVPYSDQCIIQTDFYQCLECTGLTKNVHT